MTPTLRNVIAGKTLQENEAAEIMHSMLSEELVPEQVAGLLVALRIRGETPDELSGFLRALKQHCVSAEIHLENVVDTCGTGGDGANTFNISTAAAFVVAGAGVPVAKHGNRSASSRCGSADVLEALQVRINSSRVEVERSVEKLNFGFFFAPLYHPTLGKVRTIRLALGVPTVFNYLGPLLNPAAVKRQLLGVSSRAQVPVFAELLRREGSEEVMIACGHDGMDEISLSGPTEVAHLRKGKIERYEINAKDFGLTHSRRSDLIGGSAKENAAIIENILQGKETGPKRDIVAANAAATLLISGKVGNLLDGMELANHSLVSGKAFQVLQSLRRMA